MSYVMSYKNVEIVYILQLQHISVLSTFQVLNSHILLVATILTGTDIDIKNNITSGMASNMERDSCYIKRK